MAARALPSRAANGVVRPRFENRRDVPELPAPCGWLTCPRQLDRSSARLNRERCRFDSDPGPGECRGRLQVPGLRVATRGPGGRKATVPTFSSPFRVHRECGREYNPNQIGWLRPLSSRPPSSRSQSSRSNAWRTHIPPAPRRPFVPTPRWRRRLQPGVTSVRLALGTSLTGTTRPSSGGRAFKLSMLDGRAPVYEAGTCRFESCRERFVRPDDGTGRHGGLRSRRSDACRFDPCSGHTVTHSSARTFGAPERRRSSCKRSF